MGLARRRHDAIAVVIVTFLIMLLTSGNTGAAWFHTAASAAGATAPGSCPNRTTTPPAVDSSENPKPGSPVLPPLPVPGQPIGGDRMGACSTILPAEAPEPPGNLRFQSWVLFDVDSGAVMAARDPHARLRPASLAKLLLALTIVRNLDPSTVVVGTQDDADADGTKVGVGPAGRYTVDQLLHGLLMHSGNDAAHALAMRLGGIPQALDKENALAHELGAMDTRIASPSGLDAPGMSSSAYDLSIFFDQMLHNPYLASIIATRQYPFPGSADHPASQIFNDNELLTGYRGDIGGKTGYTDDATHTFANAAERRGHKIALVMMHNDNRLEGMYANARQLMDYGFTLMAAKTRPVGQIVVPAPPNGSSVASTGADRLGTNSHHAAGAESSTKALGVSLATVALTIVALATALSWRRRGSTGYWTE